MKGLIKQPLFQSDKSLFTRELVTGELHQVLTSLGVRDQYSGHSFRKGATISARDAGLSNDEIMLLGR